MEMLLAIIVLLVVIDVVAIVAAWTSELSLAHKIAWTIVILVLPVAGPVFYFLVSDQESDWPSGGHNHLPHR